MLDKTYTPKDIEDKFYTLWEEKEVAKSDPNDDRPPFCLMIPPPNVTGTLHIGHAFSYTLQDTLIRYKRMSNFNVLWQPGQDHAGIATQIVVERELAKENIKKDDLGREKFIEKVWEWKEKSGGQIIHQLKKLGALPDWSRNRFTLDDGLSEAVRKTFCDLYDQGYIYRGKKLVNWDPKLKTAIADLEVIQKEHNGHLWHLKYPVENSDDFLIVATTRPETMFGDTAVAVNPEDERYQHLIGKNVILPLSNRIIPIVADEHADPDSGSGAVKITPAHDFNDFEVGQRHNLPQINILNEEASLNENVPQAYQGLDRFEAREKAVQALDELGLLEKVEEHTQTLPICERTGIVVEPRLSDQWFVDTSEIVKPAIEAVKQEKTKIIPKQWENTYFEWLNNIQPWCISRQLWWGHRIPAWYGPDNQIIVARDQKQAEDKAFDLYGKKVDLRQDPDVLDTWFSSALWPFSTLDWPNQTAELKKYYPTSVLITGFDIIFFWVARMMMMGLHFMKEVPFEKVYIHALVRDEKGQKMSKSKGNVADPLDLIDKYGTDALRFTFVAMAAQGRDIKLSESRIEGYRNFATKLWNAARFCEMNGCQYSNSYSPIHNNLNLNKWIVSETISLAQKVQKSFDEYRYNDVAHEIYHFVWHNFCDWYLELSKPVLNGDNKDDIQETQNCTAWVLGKLLQILHPIMPFITEELWEKLGYSSDKLLAETIYDCDETLLDSQATNEIRWVINLITNIRTVRAEMNIPPALFVHLNVKDLQSHHHNFLKSYDSIIKRLARLQSIETINEDAPKGSIQFIYDSATFSLPVAEIIDISKEKERLSKELKKVSDEINKIDTKLDNKAFLDKAPSHVIETQKNKLTEAQEKFEKLNSALEKLKAI